MKIDKVAILVKKLHWNSIRFALTRIKIVDNDIAVMKIPTLTVKEKARAEKPGEQGIFGSRTKERMLHVKRSG